MSQVRETTINELTPDEHNANVGTERGRYMLDHSLRQYGAGRSILVDKEGRVIAGNKTLETAADIGIEDVVIVQTDGTKLVAVQRTDLDLSNGDDTARLLAYADNRSSETGLAWDAEAIEFDLGAGLDLSDMFKTEELEEILGDLMGDAPEDPGALVGRADILQEKWQVKRGQVWEIASKTVKGKSHRVMCGDSTCAEDVGRLMENESEPSFCFTDPPYNVGKDYGNSTNDAQSPNGYCQWSALWFRVAKQFCDGIVFTPGAVNLWMWPQIERPKWLAIWVKKNQRSRNGAGGWNAYEPVLCYGKVKVDYDVWDGLMQDEDVGHIVNKTLGPWKDILEGVAKRRRLIVDLFTGSGTTLIACEQTKRIGYGMEIEPKYVAVTLERLAGMGLEPRLCES